MSQLCTEVMWNRITVFSNGDMFCDTEVISDSPTPPTFIFMFICVYFNKFYICKLISERLKNWPNQLSISLKIDRELLIKLKRHHQPDTQ